MLPICIWGQLPFWRTININPKIEIQHIETDSLGFLWMTDQNKLYRFDGIDLVKKIHLENENITTLKNHSGKLLLGTSLGRVLSVDPNTSRHTVIQDSSVNQQVSEILYIDDKHYVIVSYGSGIRLIHDGSVRSLGLEDGLISNEVYDIAYFNKLYYLATDQGIQILDPLNENPLTIALTMDDGLADLVVPHLLAYNDMLWYTDYDGYIGRIDIHHKITNYKFDNRSKVNSILAYNQVIYIANEDGLTKFSDGKFISQYPYKNVENVIDVEKDNKGNLWIVTSDRKLYQGNLYFDIINTDFSDIRAFTKIGDTFVVGNQNGLYTFKNKQISQINSQNITHLINAGNYILVGTFSQGVMVYDNDFQLIDQIEEWEGIRDQSVLHLFYKDGYVFVSSLSGVMQFSLIEGKLAPFKSFNSVIGPNYIYTIQGLGSKLYLGSDRKGLIVWDSNTDLTYRYEKFDSGKKIGSIYSIAIDTNGKVWFTSDKESIGYLDNDTIAIMNKDGSNLDNYTSLITISNGNLLAVRGASIDIIDPVSRYVMNFDKELGINNSISFLNTTLSDGQDTYFVHDHNIFRYTSDLAVNLQPEVIIDEVLINLSPITGQKSFTQDENNIEFNYTGSWLTNPSNLSYQYKLEGLEEDWRSTKDNSVSFSKLPPGKYNFRLRATANGQFYNQPEDSYNFEIKKHFYNLWWVRGLALLLISILGWQGVKSIEARKKEKLALEKLNIENQFINLKNQLNPHFLFNAFNTLIGMIEEDSNGSVAFVERMTDFYRNMLEHGEHNLIKLNQEIDMLNQYIDILKARFNGQLDIQLSIDENAELYELPPMTLQLLLENCVKHNVVSTKNPLKVIVKQSAETIVVWNQKRKLLQDSKGTNTGLNNIKRRFELVDMQAPIIHETSESFEVIIKLKPTNI